MIPQIYDIRIDGSRDVTQADVDELVNVRKAYGYLRTRLMAESMRAQTIATGDIEQTNRVIDHLIDPD